MTALALISSLATVMATIAPLGAAFGADAHDAAGAADYDSYGGWTGLHGQKTGFFHTERLGQRWWLVTPDGNAFFSKGVCAIDPANGFAPSLKYSPYAQAIKAKYKSDADWAAGVVRRFGQWGLNTAGAWSNREMMAVRMPYTPILNLAAATTPDMWLKGKFPDVFDPAFAAAVDEQARKKCAERKDDPYLLGYFLDNEMRWHADWRGKENLLEIFLAMSAGAPGRVKADDFLAARADPRATVAEADAEEFLGLIAAEYFRVSHDAVRKYDPNHLILGCRFAGMAPQPVLRAMKGRVDIISINTYDIQPPLELMQKMSALTECPTMITEFSFRAQDSGLPNTKGAGHTVTTQKQRAHLFERFVDDLLKEPSCVGYHWFQFVDEPAEGRFDGENSNYGVVNKDDEPYEELTGTMTKVNKDLESRRNARN